MLGKISSNSLNVVHAHIFSKQHVKAGHNSFTARQTPTPGNETRQRSSQPYRMAPA